MSIPELIEDATDSASKHLTVCTLITVATVLIEDKQNSKVVGNVLIENKQCES